MLSPQLFEVIRFFRLAIAPLANNSRQLQLKSNLYSYSIELFGCQITLSLSFPSVSVQLKPFWTFPSVLADGKEIRQRTGASAPSFEWG